MSLIDKIEHFSLAFMIAVFAAIMIATYWPGRKSAIEKQGRIPFEDDV